MARKRVYIETSVISYLTARPSSDIVKLAKQKQTWDWWERRSQWELLISPIVMGEIRRGDPDAATKRVRAVEDLRILPRTEAVDRLADQLIAVGLIPKSEYSDALHIAIAAGYGIEYLATWNQAHIFNPRCLEKLYSTIRDAGYTPSLLVRPDYLLEDKDEA
ncbi:MAG: type II toxin-antitoxin system VapC family toxin [Planctomycetota bacterium]|nr:type II toxin-antitoxin system VapC family toxin [Planctomycetota bacterium]